MGIGLDGVFLVVDTFDGAPADLTLGEKTALFEPFIYKMHYFTKTGSGQT